MGEGGLWRLEGMGRGGWGMGVLKGKGRRVLE